MKINIMQVEELDRLETLEDWQSEFDDEQIVEMLKRYQTAQFNSQKYRQSEQGKETAKKARETAKVKLEMMKTRLAELEAAQKEKAL